MKWYISQNGETIGPIEEATVREWVSSREISADAFLRDEAATGWAQLAQTPFAALQRESEAPSNSELQPPSPAAATEVAPGPSAPKNVTLLQALMVFGAVIFFIYAYATCGDTSASKPPPLPSAPTIPATASPAPTLDELAAPLIASVDSSWAGFDALPAKQRTKAALQSKISALSDYIERLPEPIRPMVASHVMKGARHHISVWSSVGTSAAGVDETDLVPSANTATCLMWGSTWVNDIDTLSALMSMGFQRIGCPTKVWILKDEANVCYLWSVDEEDPHAKGAATVWTSLELLQRAQVVGRRTDDEGPIALMALMDQGSVTKIGGPKATITETGPGWFRVVGDNFAGFVPAELCHHTATK